MFMLFLISSFLPEVLATIAVVAAFCIAIFQSKDDTKRFLNLTLIVSVFLCVILIMTKVGFDKKYSYVPDLVGLTYDEAILSLQEVGIKPQFALISSNNVSSTTCRVSWQSLSADTIVNKGTLCILIMDDYYYSNAIPAIQHIWDESGGYVYIGFRVNDDESLSAQLSCVSNSSKVLNTFEKESQIQAVGYVPSLVSESFVNMLVDAAISYLNYAKDLEFAIASVSHTTLNFGKLLPQDGSIMSYDFYNATVNDTDWLIAIPRAIDIGSYQYVCAIVSENGNCYELNMSVIVA